MTEREWLTCAEPTPMLETLRDRYGDSNRKMRLYIAGCCYLLGLHPTEGVLFGLDVGARLAEAGGVKLQTARVILSAGQAFLECGASGSVSHSYLTGADGELKRAALPFVLESALVQLACSRDLISSAAWEAGQFRSAGLTFSRQAELLRDLFGNPFLPLQIVPEWLTWNDSIVREMSEAIYEEFRLPDGTFENERLAVLSDALEEAGCTDSTLLDHLRSPGPHVRGCWALDLILGKE